MADEKKQRIRASIMGSSFYPNAAGIIMRLRPGAKLVLKREPENRFDKNAIAIYFSNIKLGHIGRGLAELLAPRMDQGLVVECEKNAATGGVINLSWDEAKAPADAPAVPEESGDDRDFMNRFRGLGL